MPLAVRGLIASAWFKGQMGRAHHAAGVACVRVQVIVSRVVAGAGEA